MPKYFCLALNYYDYLLFAASILFALLNNPADSESPAIITGVNKSLACPMLPAKAQRSLFLWSIDAEHLQVKSYFFGTIHVAYDQVWDYVSDTVKAVFAEADPIVFELELHDPETIEMLLRCKNLEGGQRLDTLLPSSLYARLKDYMRRFRYRLARWAQRNPHPTSQLSSSPIPVKGGSRVEMKRTARRLYIDLVGEWEKRRPVWLLFLLYQLGDALSSSSSLSINDLSTPMLDVFLAQQAQAAGKRLRAIELPEEQCNPLRSLDEAQLLFAINYTLAYLEWRERAEGSNKQLPPMQVSATPRSLTELVAHYRCGSLAASVFAGPTTPNAKGLAAEDGQTPANRSGINSFSLTEEEDARARAIDRLLVEEIIRRRNVRMASRADELLKRNGHSVHFFALGAGHFLSDATSRDGGDDGSGSLLDILQQRYGYRIEAVEEEGAAAVVEQMRKQRLSGASRRQPHNTFNAIWVKDARDSDGEERKVYKKGSELHRLRLRPHGGGNRDVGIALFEFGPDGSVLANHFRHHSHSLYPSNHRNLDSASGWPYGWSSPSGVVAKRGDSALTMAILLLVLLISYRPHGLWSAIPFAIYQ